MGIERKFFTPLHTKTQRKYIERMADDKVACMLKARAYEFDYWDGDRRYGYGGYSYDGRWKPVAEAIIAAYGLTADSKVLDVGCGKAFLLYELKQLLPGLAVQGFDRSQHGIATAPEGIRSDLTVRFAEQVPYPWPDRHFDLVMSLGCLHNLRVFDLKKALQEIERVGRQRYVMVEGYRNELELFNLECWALTAESLFHVDEWTWLYHEFGYTGDYEFIFFE